MFAFLFSWNELEWRMREVFICIFYLKKRIIESFRAYKNKYANVNANERIRGIPNEPFKAEWKVRKWDGEGKYSDIKIMMSNGGGGEEDEKCFFLRAILIEYARGDFFVYDDDDFLANFCIVIWADGGGWRWRARSDWGLGTRGHLKALSHWKHEVMECVIF